MDYQLVTNASMATSVTPVSPLSLDLCAVGSFQVIWTGTPTGSFVVEVSNADSDRSGATSNWVDISSLITPTLTAPAGSAGSMYINLDNIGAKYVRIRYVATSGTGVLNVWGCGKVTQ